MGLLTNITLGLIAIAALVAACLAVRLAYREGLTEDDSPYRAGLDAAAEISALAFETERLIYAAAEATRQREEES